ncbi:hypothetical protein PQR53_08475 [Paraburkholderia fungorum]|uniref:hypothetical protein n=1 Tax=Paraburkholderia fungorum TaxID=134537 RepID=UPI0038BB05A2
MTERRLVRLTVAEHEERQRKHAAAWRARTGQGKVPSDRVHRAAIEQAEAAREAEREARAGDETFTRGDLDRATPTGARTVQEMRIQEWENCAPGSVPFSGSDLDSRVSRAEGQAIRERVDPHHNPAIPRR